jgi:hypothetical protein
MLSSFAKQSELVRVYLFDVRLTALSRPIERSDMAIRSSRCAPVPCGTTVALLAVSVFLAASHAVAAPSRPSTPSPPIVALAARPATLLLDGPYAEARALVEARLAGGERRDVSDRVRWAVADRAVAAVDTLGTVRPLRDGKTALVARYRGREARVPVVAQGVNGAPPPRFLTDVLPILTRAGCNQGACHGAASGKGGLKLSLLGYDPDADHEALTRASGSRRISRVLPERSLMLLKATASVPHKGGRRFDAGGPEYRLLLAWIAAGASSAPPSTSHAEEPTAAEPRVTRLEVIPATCTLAVGQTQRFLVRAHYADGSSRDATPQTLFTASDEPIATVDADGTAKAVGPGEGAVVIRYQGLVAIARVVSPFARPRPTTGNPRPTTGAIDRLVSEKLAALGLQASGRCTDADFLRRAYLDVIGLPPTPEEARAFLWSSDKQKREKLIERLLARPEFADFWTLKWADILRAARGPLSEKGMYAFHRWIRHSVALNRPWDQFARELLLARGSPFDQGAANYFRVARRPEELAETTAQVFLGVRIQCAKCHNHPYERWTQNQYYQMAAFFARVRSKRGERPEENEVYLASDGEVNHPKTGARVIPTALDAAPLPQEFTGDRRLALARWLTSAENPFFARALVNRIWRHFMGRGLVEPVDDLRATNPPSNEALLDWLAEEFTRGGYDVKHLMGVIMRSETYQRSSQATANNARDDRYYSHIPFKRLGAEQLLDAIADATGVPETFEGFPRGTRAAQLPDSGVPSYFLELFGRPARQIACECERVNEPNVAQVLHLMNNAGLNKRIAGDEGRVARLLAAGLPPARIVDELYLATLSRFPTPEESRVALKALPASDVQGDTAPRDDDSRKRATERRRAAEDLLWALLNSTEFLFNH